ncbi:hypothetical protein ACF0H5_002391 [Mactra antiquata]
MASSEDLSSKTEVTEEDLEKMKEKLLIELQNEIQTVDMNVTSLAESFDALYNNLMKTLEDIDNDEQARVQDSGSRTESFRKGQENLSQLKISADMVKSRQTKAIKSLSKLIHFIYVEREEICTNQILSKCERLHIGEYCQRTDVPNNETDSYIEMLQEENKRLQERYKLMSEHAKLVRKRETLASEECCRLRKQLNGIYAKMDLTKSSDYCNVYNNDLSADDENVNDRKNVDGDMKHSLKISVDGSTQNESGSDETMHDSGESIQTQQNELKQAKERISEMESQLADIKKYVITRNVYEVCSVYTRPIFNYYPEKNVVTRIETLMSELGYLCNVMEKVTNDQYATLVFISGGSRWEWDEVIKKANLREKDNSSTAVIMLYRVSGGDLAQKEARERHSVTLDNFPVFSFAFYASGALSHDRVEGKRLVQFIRDVSQPKSIVTSCRNCKNVSSKK